LKIFESEDRRMQIETEEEKRREEKRLVFEGRENKWCVRD
jgi:hypothetical protein